MTVDKKNLFWNLWKWYYTARTQPYPILLVIGLKSTQHRTCTCGQLMNHLILNCVCKLVKWNFLIILIKYRTAESYDQTVQLRNWPFSGWILFKTSLDLYKLKDNLGLLGAFSKAQVGNLIDRSCKLSLILWKSFFYEVVFFSGNYIFYSSLASINGS